MITLKEKFRGCIAASWAGSAMGAPVEGWLPDRIEATHGFVDTLLPYRHYRAYTDWERPPGTTEDGKLAADFRWVHCQLQNGLKVLVDLGTGSGPPGNVSYDKVMRILQEKGEND